MATRESDIRALKGLIDNGYRVVRGRDAIYATHDGCVTGFSTDFWDELSDDQKAQVQRGPLVITSWKSGDKIERIYR